MTSRPTFLPLLLLALASASPALASSTAPVEAEGGSIRLVTAGEPDAEGKLRGALVVDLEPGWKTYWRDPGDAGVPPTLHVTASTNVASAEFSFPVPTRFDDGYSVWAGYDRPVSLPVVFSVPEPGSPVLIDAELFLGICETICIPVAARLTLDPASAPDDPADMAVVADAFAALPAAANAGFGTTGARLEDTNLIVEAHTPGTTPVELFVAGTAEWMFGVPDLRESNDGKAVFAVPVLSAPEPPVPVKDIPYTLVAGDEAVSGTFDLAPE